MEIILLENIINSCFLNVINFTAKPYTSALSALTDEEKNQGSVCIDIGAGTTSISVFIDGSIGSKNFTAYTMDFTKKYVEINSDYRS